MKSVTIINLFLFCIYYYLTNSFEVANIPEIDLGLFISGSNEIKFEIAELFSEGFHRFGGVRIVNHSIPFQLTSDIFNCSSLYFNKSLEYKSSYQYGSDQGSAGYIPYGTEITGNIYERNYENDINVDIVEGFYVYNNWNNLTVKDIQSGNVYIPKYDFLPVEFRYIIPEYWILQREFLSNIHYIAHVALGFDVNDNIFELNMTHSPLFTIRLANYFKINSNEYPFTDTDNIPFGLRFAAHQDYTGFSFIQNGPNLVDGLQVYINNNWYDIEPKFNSIIVIGGEFIQRWTNDYWISSLHRVIYNNYTINKQRLSIITFTSPNRNIDIDVCTLY